MSTLIKLLQRNGHDERERENNHKATRFEWWMQSFKLTPKGKQTITGWKKDDVVLARKKTSDYPASELLQASFGLKVKQSNKFFVNKSTQLKCYINTFSLKNWALSAGVRDIILGELLNSVNPEQISEILATFNTENDLPENVQLEDYDVCAP